MRRSPAGPMLIVLPSLLSGAGLAFVLAAFLVNNVIVRDVFVVIGAIALWFDFFVTMALIRYSLRSINRRLAALEARGDE